MKIVPTTPIEGPKPGTWGLRKKTRVFLQSHYLENFVQSAFNALGGANVKTYVISGDGRYFNEQAIQTILKMAEANGAKRAIVGQSGLLSTPAASHLIRLNRTDGGFILSASHNPGGIDQDFGIKFNTANGGPAPESITESIFENTKVISTYKKSSSPDVDLSNLGTTRMGEMQVQIVDPVADYAELMQSLFDFDAIRDLFKSGFTMCFDAMHAITGPYAKYILEDQLGAKQGTVRNGLPLPDFGGGHPDPNPIWAHELMGIMMDDDAPDFGAASDGDGDRNMIIGRNIYVTPSDSLAMLAANAHLAPGYADGISGIARSMPTSGAADLVAAKLGINIYETPTGWKFFGNLLDAGKVSICGEESAGTGSDHVREKDGLWAVLLWLNILAIRKISVADLVLDHWQTFGRNFYSRHDFEAVTTDKADRLMQGLRDRLSELPGSTHGDLTISFADDFSYEDSIDGSIATQQGIRIGFEGGARAVFRLSGTGTEGATLRLYLEQFTSVASDLTKDAAEALSSVEQAAHLVSQLTEIIGRSKPDVIT
ncbi:MAG: alpha-D-glucose phosphate-specific phosphoglucomutase [Pseudomonadota bacterium]